LELEGFDYSAFFHQLYKVPRCIFFDLAESETFSCHDLQGEMPSTETKGLTSPSWSKYGSVEFHHNSLAMIPSIELPASSTVLSEAFALGQENAESGRLAVSQSIGPHLLGRLF